MLLFLVVSPHQIAGFEFMFPPEKEPDGWIYAKTGTTGDYCWFKGYIPGGNKVMVQKISAPTAEMEEGMFGGLQSNMGKIVAAAQGT